MQELRIYVETSVWSHYYADDAPDAKAKTREFLRQCREAGPAVELYVSQVVLDELGEAAEDLADRLLHLVSRHGALLLPAREEVLDLAEAYAAHGAIPRRKLADRTHAAIATVNQVNVLVSWNYRDFVNVPQRKKIQGVNVLLGYHNPIEIVTPPEVFGNEVQSETD